MGEFLTKNAHEFLPFRSPAAPTPLRPLFRSPGGLAKRLASQWAHREIAGTALVGSRRFVSSRALFFYPGAGRNDWKGDYMIDAASAIAGSVFLLIQSRSKREQGTETPTLLFIPRTQRLAFRKRYARVNE